MLPWLPSAAECARASSPRKKKRRKGIAMSGRSCVLRLYLGAGPVTRSMVLESSMAVASAGEVDGRGALGAAARSRTN